MMFWFYCLFHYCYSWDGYYVTSMARKEGADLPIISVVTSGRGTVFEVTRNFGEGVPWHGYDVSESAGADEQLQEKDTYHPLQTDI